MTELENVGLAGEMPGSNGGFTMAAFKASSVPVGTALTPLAPAQAEIERLRADCEIYQQRADHEFQKRKAAEERVKVLSEALGEIYAVVMGECPSVLDEDSGGNSVLALQIERALRGSGS